jgi:predicted nucleic acid-binding protein
VSFLLDTNIVSEARKGERADAGVRTWLASVRATELYISVLVVGEIRQGVERLRRRDPAQAEVFDAWLERLRRDFGDRIVPVTTDVAEEWGRMNADDPVPVLDGLMAATAKAKGMTFVTRNTADISGTGVSMLNPFGSAP